jgi:hypothetical protein
MDDVDHMDSSATIPLDFSGMRNVNTVIQVDNSDI